MKQCLWNNMIHKTCTLQVSAQHSMPIPVSYALDTGTSLIFQSTDRYDKPLVLAFLHLVIFLYATS